MIKQLSAYLKLCRPWQYLKNGFVWMPLLFGYQLSNPKAVMLTAAAFIAFCLMASCIYVINDLADIQEDRRHPAKRHRPLAGGAVRPVEAAWLALLLFCAAVAIAFICLPITFVYVLIAYFFLNAAYSQGLKRIPILDIVCIAVGFVLRITAGCIAAQVASSPWVMMMAFLLALFLALAKRRDDILLADRGHRIRRKAIGGYNLEFISLAMGIMASVIIVAYILYTVSPGVVAKHGTNYLYMTGIWVLLGLLRYLQITFVEGKSGSPTHVLMKDYPLQAVIAGWLINVYVLLYR